VTRHRHARRLTAIVLLLGTLAAACSDPGEPAMSTEGKEDTAANERVATFGAGCFWCVEAVFKELRGVTSVTSGFSGGHVENPTYKQVCAGATGHAEVAQVRYDPEQVRYEDLLEVFWKTHDPTTRNRQGADVGTMYRSAIFYHDEQQREAAERIKKELDASGAFAAPIVTEIVPFEAFYAAEDYHQDFFELNPDQPYCRAVVGPKVEKFRKVFEDRLKPKK
jgi:peptide-methionine (S)-S-oxide reductase